MRSIMIAVVGCFLTAAAWAQQVTLKFNGSNTNRRYEVVIDGKSYYSTSGNDQFTITDLAAGSHSLSVYRLRANNSTTRTGSSIYSKDFVLRNNYDMNINVNGNGNIAFTESRIRNRNNDRNVVAMSTTDFNQLLATVNARTYQSSKLTTITDAFNQRNSYFTAEQARQLISTITNENSRLELAKLVYDQIVDPVNIEQLYSLFNYQSSRQNFDAYVSANVNNNIYNRNNGVNNNTTTTARVAISSYNYEQLLTSVKNSNSSSTRYSSIRDAFVNTNYTFSSAQIRGLLTYISSEADRLALAKYGYSRVSDPLYFSTVFELLPSTASRTELNAYIVNNGGTSISVNDTYARIPMTDAMFSELYNDAANNLFQSGKVSAVRNAFTNVNNIFTTIQIRQLLSLVNAESDRLALAKLAYARTADPTNYSSVYDVLASQSSRNDLDTYIRNNGNAILSGSETVAVVAMSDADFSNFMLNQKLRLFRSAKVAAVKALLNDANNYFTVAQVKELVEEGKAESDRLAIAKLAYKKTVDPGNYAEVVALIPSAAGKADLNAHINANR